jgi:hypothetical protein
VDRKRTRPERPDVRVCARLVRLVAVMEDKEALGEEEEHEPRADDRERVARLEKPKCLRQDVEERNGNDDAAGQRNDRRQFAAQAEREQTACESREHGDPRERNCDPGHRKASL